MEKSQFRNGLIVSFATLLTSLFVCATPAFACTGIYVGADASADGTTIIARSNDTSPLDKPLIVKVFGGQDGEKITHLKAENGFEWNFPDKIYRTICYPTVKSADGSAYYAIAMNDQGVYVNGTVTGKCNEKALQENPFVENGLLEDVLPLVICCDITSAREGIEKTAKIIDERGSFEDNIIIIADKQETWYMEIYGGHQYCAIKAPSDCVTASGNDFLIETVDENSPDVICSPNLFKLPAEKGFAVYNADGKMNIYNTYAGPETDRDTCRLRTWRAHCLFSPSTSTDYNVHTKIPLFYKPDKKVSLSEVMNMYRDRYEGTPYSIDVNGKGSYRPICTETSQSIHVTQIFKDLPENMCILNWASFSNVEFNTFVPFSNLESAFDKAYTYENSNYYNLDANNAFTAAKRLNAIASQNRSKVKNQIVNFWQFQENYMQEIIGDVLHSAANSGNAQNEINDFCTAWQAQNFYDWNRIADDIEWYYMNSENVYSVKTVDGVKMLKEPVEFCPYVDIVLAAKILGWNVDEEKYQQHNSAEYDNSDWGNENQAENGGMEGYVKISSGSNTAEIHTGNGHRLSKVKASINGQDIDIAAKVYDGKTYVDMSFVEKFGEISNSEFTPISYKDISPARSNDKSPTLVNILPIAIIAVLVILVIVIVVRKISKKKK